MKDVIESSLEKLIQQKNYPCIAAVQSLLKKEYRMEVYQDFGEGVASIRLARDLLAFREEYETSNLPYLSFFAVFDDMREFSEEDFEKRLWQELSYLTSVEGLSQKWDPEFSENPEDKNFCFSLDGTAFFVVGMHPNSSRKGRQFPHPTLVFNVYKQFRELQRTGKYEAMVQLNRKRDQAFQGDANPMAVAHGDTWESIQFSGRNNSEEWKCPFHRGLKKSPENP
jgi:FPC/CPF motif-containing protein YcgG